MKIEPAAWRGTKQGALLIANPFPHNGFNPLQLPCHCTIHLIYTWENGSVQLKPVEFMENPKSFVQMERSSLFMQTK